MKKSSSAQKLVNSFPEWSSTRSDEQSLGFQLANVIGQTLDDLNKQLVNHERNYYLTTANLSEIDLIYKLELSSSFTFTSNTSDSTQTDYTEPTVSGKIGNTWYKVSQSADNDIKSFWYNAVPTRLTSTVTASGDHFVLYPTSVNNSPITTNLIEPVVDGKLSITISGGTEFLSIENNEPSRGTVILEGLTKKGTEESETLIFLFNDTKDTTKEWDKLDRVSVYGISPEDAKISIKSLRIDDAPYLDFYNLDYSVGAEKVDTFWKLGVTNSGFSTLDLVRYETDQFKNLLVGLTGKEVVRRTELLSNSGLRVQGLDIAQEPFSDRVWVCSTNVLHAYDTRPYYPNLKELKDKQFDSIIKIQADSYHKIIGDIAEVSIIFARPIKDLARHRVTLTKPDGTKYGVVNSTLVATSTDYWTYGAVDNRKIRPDDSITLEQRGDYIITVEAVMTDTSTYKDQIIISAQSLSPLVSLNLPFTASGMHFDSSHYLWIADNTGVKHRVDFAYDTMLVDYDQKVIYFKEQYEDIKVIS